MTRIFNFCSGPAVLPQTVLQTAQQDLVDYQGQGLSILEMSHRGVVIQSIFERAEADLRSLLQIPSNYKVLFLSGGASLQFSIVPLNLFGHAQAERPSADYVNTGIWSTKAIEEARRYGHVSVAASSETTGFDRAPACDTWHINPSAAYLHYTPNETIGGVAIHEIPETGGVPLVADMSSVLLSGPLDVSRFGVIYAGAQKNIGPAGVTLVIIREDLLACAPHPETPTLLRYKTHATNHSMYNTPPVYAVYLVSLVLQWLQAQGGLAAMAAINQQKAQALYEVIDTSDFYHNRVRACDRSIMNVPFTLRDVALELVFLQEAAQAGLLNLEGHRSVGGLRASIYNAMPLEGVMALVDFMRDFMRRHG